MAPRAQTSTRPKARPCRSVAVACRLKGVSGQNSSAGLSNYLFFSPDENDTENVKTRINIRNPSLQKQSFSFSVFASSKFWLRTACFFLSFFF